MRKVKNPQSLSHKETKALINLILDGKYERALTLCVTTYTMHGDPHSTHHVLESVRARGYLRDLLNTGVSASQSFRGSRDELATLRLIALDTDTAEGLGFLAALVNTVDTIVHEKNDLHPASFLAAHLNA